MIRTLIFESTNPRPEYKMYRFDGIRFYKTIYPVGSYNSYLYHQSIVYSDQAICQIQVSGTMIEPTGVWPDRTAGWISTEDSFVIPAGTWARETTEETELWCCLGQLDDEDLSYITPIKLIVGDEIVLTQNTNMFIIKGQVEIDGKAHDAIKRVKAASGDKTATVTKAGYAFLWNSDVLSGR